jgi:ribosomal-protein-alanine N-acetyltransferase
MHRNVALREYRARDLEALCRLDESCFPPEFRFDQETMRRLVGYRRSIVVVAEGDEGLCGFVIVHIEGSGTALGGYVVTLDVAEGSRRSGLAGRLMEEVTKQSLAAGAVWMGLHVFADNGGAIAFYERAGYVRGELIPGFYGKSESGSEMDAWVYRRWIGPEMEAEPESTGAPL